MIIKFNNTNYEIFDLDSIESILNRVAAKNNTLPSLLYFEPELPDISSLNSSINYTFVDYRPLLRDATSFSTLYDDMKPKLSLKLVQILDYYIVLNRQLAEREEQGRRQGDISLFITPILNEIQNDINQIETTTRIDVRAIWSDRIAKKTSFVQSLKNLELQVEQEVSEFKDFQSVVGLTYTEFNPIDTRFIIEFKSRLNLTEVFNAIRLSHVIAFATTQDLYKISRNLIPYSDWIYSFDKYKNIKPENNILLKALVINLDDTSSTKDYIDVLISKSQNDIYEVSLLYNDIYEIERENLISEIQEATKLGSIVNEKIIKVSGNFLIPNMYINRYIFEDLVLNNELFSNLMVINESVIKKKSTIYIYFSNALAGDITISITNQIVGKKLPIGAESELFPVNSKYVSVHIVKVENLQKLSLFQSILSKLLELYKKKAPEIIEAYKQAGVKILDEELQVQETEDIEKMTIGRKLRKIDPFVFAANYTSKCSHPVSFITDEEASKIEDAQVMTFPKARIGTSEPKKYICPYDVYKYPGLRNNPFPNKNQLPYLPCCFSDDQTTKLGSKYRAYYLNENIEVRQRVKGEGTSTKILTLDKTGILPANIDLLFFSLVPTANFRRRGSPRNQNSFLYCILDALNEQTRIRDIKPERLDAELTNIRKSLVSSELLNSCRQELYDLSNDEIKAILQDENVYLDPALFVHLLENKYKCNIFIFTRTSDKSNLGEFLIPKNTKGYFKLKNDYETVCVYQHMGSESEEADYPQCELIIRQSEITTNTYFDFDSFITNSLFDIFNDINLVWYNSTRIKAIEFDLGFHSKIKLISQTIDSFGKCRVINLEFKYGDTSRKISLQTSPLPPFALVETNEIFQSDTETALAFFGTANIEILFQQVDLASSKVVSITGSRGNATYTISISEGLPIENIPINSKLSSVIKSTENSALDYFSLYQRITRYIIEYSYWLFSKFLKDEGITENQTDFLRQFQEQYIKIDPAFQYNMIPQTFSMTSGVMSDRKLVLKSEETLKRLLYVLKLYIQQDLKTLLDYYTRINIENYYLGLSDFDKIDGQLILQGATSVAEWINEKTMADRLVSNEVKLDETGPYYFHNKLVSEKVYLALNVDTINKAMSICSNWFYDGFLTAGGSSAVLYTSILYAYYNPDKIVPYEIEGVDTGFELEILATKREGIAFYTALIPLV